MNDFNREADILEEIKSPYIVKFYGAMITDEYYCSVTEFAPCGSLENVLKKQVSSVMRIKFLCDIAHGMMYLHQNSIIHRDLKPGNVLCFDCTNVSAVACCKITDFGESRFFKNGKANLMTKGVGTSVYMVIQLLCLFCFVTYHLLGVFYTLVLFCVSLQRCLVGQQAMV